MLGGAVKLLSFLENIWLAIQKSRLRKMQRLPVGDLQAFAVRSQMGDFQINATIGGCAFQVIVNRDVLAKLTPQLRKVSNEERFAECRKEMLEVIRRKIRAGEFEKKNLLYVNTADLDPT
jgi:hypothetical protein